MRADERVSRDIIYNRCDRWEGTEREYGKKPKTAGAAEGFFGFQEAFAPTGVEDKSSKLERKMQT